MNKKEINEIRKNLRSESGFMTIGKIASVYVKGAEDRTDIDDNILYMDITNYNLMNSSLSELILQKFCKSLTGKMGKSLLEFEISDDDIGNTIQDTLDSKFITNNDVKNYINHIIENVDFVSPYVIFAAYCTYSVLNKDEPNPEDDPEYASNSYNYNFIITCICPVEVQFNGIICTAEPSIENETEFIRVVSEPVHSWIYPAFNDRMPDTDRILYSAKSVKLVSPSIVENVLGCDFFQKADEQKNSFTAVLTKSIGDVLNYETVEQINDSLCIIAEQNSHETEPTTVNKEDVTEMLDAIGIDDTHKEHFEKVWKNTFDEDTALNVNALIDSKSTLTAGSFKITYNNVDSERVKISTDSYGKRMITIDIDDDISINGINVTS